MTMHHFASRAGRRPPFGIGPNRRPACPTRRHFRAFLCCAIIFICAFNPTRTIASQGSLVVALAAFDNVDTSGEDASRTAAHAARVRAFAGLLRDDLTAQKRFKVVRLTCPHPPCSAASMAPDDLVRAAQQSGARLLVYGGIHKESTLVQWGKIEVLDLNKHRLVLNKNFSFRGDTDQAFRRAAAFMARYFEALHP
jgi:Protein of unknown function (DUF2380)